MPDKPEIVSPARIERLLEIACVYNVPLSVTAESGDAVCHYTSRMLELKRTPAGNSLVIDRPVTDGPAIALTPKTRITIFFALEKRQFLFETEILRKTAANLESRRNIPALEVTYPNVLSTGDRRRFTRVPAPTGKPISVECGVIGDVIDWFVQEPGAWNFPSHMHFRGHIVNISVGGVLIMVENAGKTRLRVGTKLGMRFSLAPDETPIILKGIIRRVEQKTPDGKQAVAIEFIDTSDKFEYKLAVNRLYRYVAERHQEITVSRARPKR